MVIVISACKKCNKKIKSVILFRTHSSRSLTCRQNPVVQQPQRLQRKRRRFRLLQVLVLDRGVEPLRKVAKSHEMEVLATSSIGCNQRCNQKMIRGADSWQGFLGSLFSILNLRPLQLRALITYNVDKRRQCEDNTHWL